MPFLGEGPSPHLCSDCLSDIHQFDRARAAGIYRGLLREIIQRFKYEGKTFLARPLAQLVTHIAAGLADYQDLKLIIPVPLHPRRLRQRGFNQASLLARQLGSNLGLPVDYSLLKRSRWTEPQTGLSRKQRAKNVKGAFALINQKKVGGKGVLLLDDVITTGETVNQCVRVLKAGGARKVVVLTVARTVPI
jgi:ComF family protein